jgi:hypothetical protein
MRDVHSIVREAEQNYVSGTVKLGKYVDFSMHDTIETIDAYLNSQHTSGKTDSLGREKPFFNIVTAAVNIWYRATDLDRKDIRIKADKRTNVASAFMADILLKEWMKEARFNVFLNQWGRALARYGSAVVKFVEKDGKLDASVISWNRLIVDPIDFTALPVIEKFYKTPDQLRQNELYDQDAVTALIEAQEERQTIDGHKKDNQANFIELFEVHGEMSVAVYKRAKGIEPTEEDETTYRQQMHVISYSQKKDGSYEDATLYCGYEKQSPYMITHLIEEDGRTLAIGAVEYLFDAQWMQNHSVKNMKDTLDLATKLVFQTADSKFIGRNVLSAIETGDILIHQPNMPLTQVNNSKPDIQAFQAFGDQWRALAQELSSTPDAIRGNTLPSGTPYSLGAILQQQANSLFEIMTENKGNHIEEMCRTFIIPHLKKKMDNAEEISAILDEQGIAQLDAMYVPVQAAKNYNKRTTQKMFDNIETLISGGEPEPLDPFNRQQEEQSVREEMAPLGNQRFFVPSDVSDKTWKESLKDLEWKVDVEVTNESVDKQAVLQTLSTVMQTLAGNPAVLQDPNMKMLFGEILKQTSVVSPIQLSSVSAQPAVAAPTPAPATGAPTGVAPVLPVR